MQPNLKYFPEKRVGPEKIQEGGNTWDTVFIMGPWVPQATIIYLLDVVLFPQFAAWQAQCYEEGDYTGLLCLKLVLLVNY